MTKKSLYLAPDSEVIELKPDGYLLTGSELDMDAVEQMAIVEGEWTTL